MTSSNEAIKDSPDLSTNSVAIGISFSERSVDEISRVVLRSKMRGVSVAIMSSDGAEIPSWIRQEPHVIEFNPSDATTGQGFRELMAEGAATHGLNGVAIHDSPDLPIDYTKTLEKFEHTDLHVVDAASATLPEEPAATQILVGIPAYNEAETIQETIADALKFVDEVVVVDDGSNDATAEQARKAGATVVSHPVNRGYGETLMTLFETAQSRDVSTLVVMDGDGQHDPNDIPQLVRRHQETGAELVIGSRFVASGTTNAPPYRRIGLLAVNILTNLSMGVLRPESWVHDTQSGYRAYSRTAIETLTNDGTISSGMAASTDILHHMHQNGYTIEEIGSNIVYDEEDQYTHHPLYHGFVLVSNILKTLERERPLTMLGIPGVVVTLLGLGFGYWTFANYLQTSTFPVGIALTSTLLLLVGVFAWFTAIILHSLNTHFETQ